MEKKSGMKILLFVLGITLVMFMRGLNTNRNHESPKEENIARPVAGDVTDLEVARDIGWGRTAQVNEFPFVVLVKPVDGRPSCTGTLIQPKFVLTAERCVIKNALGVGFVPRVQVFAGNVTRGIGVVRVVKSIFSFQKTVSGEALNTVDSDVAVLELYVPFPLSPAIQTIRLVNRDARNCPGLTGTMVGWGFNQLGELPSKLRAAKTRFFGPDCGGRSSFDSSKVWLSGFFTDGTNDATNTGTLFEGDGGAPLVTKQNGEYVQWGVGIHGRATSNDGMKFKHDFVDMRYWHTEVMNKIKGSPVLFTDVALVSPGNSILVTYNKLTGRTDTAWIGLIPASVTSTQEGPNDDNLVTFCSYYIRSPTGSCSLKVPPTTSLGKYKVRAFSSDKRDGVRIGNEVDITIEKNVPNWKNYKVSHGGQVLGVQNGWGHFTRPLVADFGPALLLLVPIVFLVCWRRHKMNVMNDNPILEHESV